jgi:hypothetical protein
MAIEDGEEAKIMVLFTLIPSYMVVLHVMARFLFHQVESVCHFVA